MNTKHTPGPWAVDTRLHVHAICCQPTRKGEHQEVAFIEVHHGVTPDCGSITAQQRTQPELAANARLIAAAPDLLAALEKAERDARAILFGSTALAGGESVDDRLAYARKEIGILGDRLRAAIARATSA